VGKLLYWNDDKNMVGLCKNNKLIISDITIKEIRQGRIMNISGAPQNTVLPCKVTVIQCNPRIVIYSNLN
jgi:hypothetical protein